MSLPAAVSHSSPTANILPYTHGLTGVNLWLNNITTQATWYPILLLALVIVVIRRWQVWSGRSRMLLTLHLGRLQQRYWSVNHGKLSPRYKKSLLTAPLIRTRHNREIQLSRAIGVGTLPSRLHTILLLTYLICNIIYCCLLDYRNQPKAALIAEIRGRTGNLAVINMVGLFLFAARNNPLIPILKVSFDTFNLFHRWIGRIVVLEGLAHCAMWAVNKVDALGWQGIRVSFATDAFVQYGLLSGIAMVLILLQTPSPIRHAFYEAFLHIHQFLALTSLIGISLHVKTASLPQVPIVFFIVGIWSSERLTRLARVVYRNISHRGCTTVTIEALEGGACRVGFRIPGSWTYRPGCHVYAYIPRISWWMSHPFSVAWVDRPKDGSEEFSRLQENHHSQISISSLDKHRVQFSFSDKCSSHSSAATVLDRQRSEISTVTSLDGDDIIMPKNTHTTVYCVMAARTGMTADLYRAARASAAGIITMRAFIEGPYGGVESLRSYGTVVLFAGGVGITHQLSHLRDLVTSFSAGLCSTRKVTLVWSVRDAAQLKWTQSWIEEVLYNQNIEQDVRIIAFVSGKTDTPAEHEKKVKQMNFPGSVEQGRVNASKVLEWQFEERVGAMNVGVCGPGAFADDIRACARKLMLRGNVDFWEEAFTW